MPGRTEVGTKSHWGLGRASWKRGLGAKVEGSNQKDKARRASRRGGHELGQGLDSVQGWGDDPQL